MRVVSVTTTPVIIIAPQPKRTAWNITMPDTSVVAGNTGRLHWAKGWAPSTVVGAPNAGQILTEGLSATESKKYQGDPAPYKGAIWATASATTEIWVDEDIEEV